MPEMQLVCAICDQPITGNLLGPPHDCAQFPKPCQHCGRVGTHTSICWAIGKGADNISVATGSSGGVPDQGATDRAETNYERMLAGEEYGPW